VSSDRAVSIHDFSSAVYWLAESEAKWMLRVTSLPSSRERPKGFRIPNLK